MKNAKSRSVHVQEVHKVQEERFAASHTSCYSIECTGATGSRLFIEMTPAQTRKLYALLQKAMNDQR